MSTSGAHFDKNTSQEFEQHMAAADAAHKKLAKGGYDRIAQHADAIKTYINSTIRTGETPTAEGLKKHIGDKAQKNDSIQRNHKHPRKCSRPMVELDAKQTH